MNQTVCPRCGAIGVKQGDIQICPQCGQECSQNIGKAFRFPIFYLSPWLLFVTGLAPLFAILSGVEWKYWAIAAFTVAAGAGWVMVARRFRHEYYDPTENLAGRNISVKKAPREEHEPTFRPAQAPQTPRNWIPLLSTARPREVYLSRAVKFGFAMCALTTAGVLLVLLRAYVRQDGIFARGWSWQRDLAPCLNFIAVELGVILMFWREAASRRILREGEATIGRWEGGEYEFCSQSGIRFRHSAPGVARNDALSSSGLVPVFYLPQEPAKSVALCSVYSRIRISAEETVRTVGRAPAHS